MPPKGGEIAVQSSWTDFGRRKTGTAAGLARQALSVHGSELRATQRRAKCSAHSGGHS